MAQLNLSLLGTISVTLDAVPVRAIESDKGRALLAYLAVESDRPQRREHLAGLLWTEQSEAHARQSLNQALYNLRGAIGDRPLTGSLPAPSELAVPPTHLIVTPQTIQFNPASDHWLDVSAYTRLIDACRRHPHARLETCNECAARLEQAVALYRGDFLAGFTLSGGSIAFDEWAVTRREQLRQLGIASLADLAAHHDGQGDIARALHYARRCVELDPLWEAGQRSLMRLLALDGQREAALKQYQGLRKTLRVELAVEPEGETRALYERLRQASHKISPAPDNLPTHLTPFVGRQTELAELCALLHDPACRLVTVFGPGGVGKTRLALEAARRLSLDFPDGVYFISLSAYQPGSLLWVLLVEALRFSLREQHNPEQQVLEYLGDKQALLIFDSFEIALEQAAWLADLLRRAPNLTALVTSRARLEISAEQAFSLGGMPVPAIGEAEIADQFEAVQLFVAFARQRQPDFGLDEQTRPGVAHLCRLVQGLPLGLLLSSAWVELYSPQEIAEQIERSLDFLEVTWSDVPARQRSLRATFDYSWNQLTPVEQDYLSALTVFRGGFSLQAAVEVTQAPARMLQSLVDKSMVSRSPDKRHQMHDLLRQFAAQRLEGHPEHFRGCYTRHSRFYLRALAEWENNLKGAHQREALEAIDREAENLRAAWRWAVVTEDWQSIAAGLEGMCWYVDLRFRFEEGERACRTALELLSPLSHSSLVSALTAWQAHFLRRLGQAEGAGQLLRTELERLRLLQGQGSDVRAEQARVLYELGELSMYTDRESAEGYYQQSLARYDELKDERGLALVLASLGEAMHHSGPLDQAQIFLDRGVDLCRILGDPRLLARCILWSGWNHLRQGNLPQAEMLILEAIEIDRTIGDRYAEAFWSAELGTVKGWMGLLQEATKLVSSSILIYRELGLKQEMTLNTLRRGLFTINMMDFQQAQQDFQECLTNSYQLNYQRGIGLGIYGMGSIALEEGDFQKAEDLIFKAFTILQGVQADEAGWCLAILVLTMRRMGQPARGWQYARQALELAVQAHVYHAAAITLLGIATLLIDAGQTERAIDLHALTMRYPLIKNSLWFYTNYSKYVDAAATSLPPEVVEAARARGRERDLFATAEELLQEFSDQAAVSPT